MDCFGLRFHPEARGPHEEASDRPSVLDGPLFQGGLHCILALEGAEINLHALHIRHAFAKRLTGPSGKGEELIAGLREASRTSAQCRLHLLVHLRPHRLKSSGPKVRAETAPECQHFRVARCPLAGWGEQQKDQQRGLHGMRCPPEREWPNLVPATGGAFKRVLSAVRRGPVADLSGSSWRRPLLSGPLSLTSKSGGQTVQWERRPAGEARPE